jgi:drug/metabolite transporter (DMT)-like permease
MVNRTLLGVLLAVLGIALVVVSALADQLDLGPHGFGWKQTSGVIAGVVLALAGAGLALRSRRPRSA